MLAASHCLGDAVQDEDETAQMKDVTAEQKYIAKHLIPETRAFVFSNRNAAVVVFRGTEPTNLVQWVTDAQVGPNAHDCRDFPISFLTCCFFFVYCKLGDGNGSGRLPQNAVVFCGTEPPDLMQCITDAQVGLVVGRVSLFLTHAFCLICVMEAGGKRMAGLRSAVDFCGVEPGATGRRAELWLSLVQEFLGALAVAFYFSTA